MTPLHALERALLRDAAQFTQSAKRFNRAGLYSFASGHIGEAVAAQNTADTLAECALVELARYRDIRDARRMLAAVPEGLGHCVECRGWAIKRQHAPDCALARVVGG